MAKPDSPQKICILRLSAIGDVCNALAMVQQLQQAFPQAKITWVCGKAEAQLLALFPEIELVVYDKRQGFKGWLALRKRLKHQRFDVLLHMQAALRASLVSLAIKANRRIGFDRARAKDGQWLFCREQIAAAGSPHVLDGFLQFLSALGVQAKPPEWHVPLSLTDQDFAAEQLAEGKHLLICPAASKSYKNWTVEGYAELAKLALERSYTVTLIGGPSEQEQALAEQLNQRCQYRLNNLSGKTSLPQLWALLQRADILLSPDTGPAHMAVAVGTPVLGLYAHHNPQRTGPYNYLNYVVSVWQQAVEQEQGKSAEQLSWRTRVKDPEAMRLIRPEQVKQQFLKMEQELGL